MPPRFLKGLDWGDLHTYYLNKLYSLYSPAVSTPNQLSTIGYSGFPDPFFEPPNRDQLTPDFLAIGNENEHIDDAQIIDVKGFERLKERFPERADQEKHIEETIKKLQKYGEIRDVDILQYVNYRNIDFQPSEIEIVVLLPFNIYEDFREIVEDAIQTVEGVLWVIEENSEEYIWRAEHDHASTDLNEHLEGGEGSGGVRTYPGRCDLVRFTRQTDRDIVKYHFTHRLLTYCSHSGIQEVHFDDLDSIMTKEFDPPMFGHLIKPEREDIWRECMYSLLRRFDLIEHASEVDTYGWKKVGFLTQARYRSSILEEVGQELGVVDNTT